MDATEVETKRELFAGWVELAFALGLAVDHYRDGVSLPEATIRARIAEVREDALKTYDAAPEAQP